MGWRDWTWLEGVAFLDRWREPDIEPDIPTCEHVREVLQAFLDGELGARDEERVRAHLALCEMCSIEEEVFLEVKARLAALRPAADDAALARLQASADRLARGEAP